MSGKPMLSVELRALLERVVAHDFAEDCQECGIGQSEAWKELRALLDKPVLESQYEGMTQEQAQAVSDGVDEILHGEPVAQHQPEQESYGQRLERQWRLVPVSELTAWVKSNQSSGGIPEVRVNSKAAVPADSPAAVFRVDAIGYRARVTLEPESPLPPDGTLLYTEQHGSIGLGAGVTVENIGFSSERGRKPYLVFDGDNRLTELNLIDVSLVSKRKTHTVADLENMGVNVEQPAPVSVAMPERQIVPDTLMAGLTRKWCEGWNDALEEVARLNGVKP